jgi:hypothetical protein
MAMDKKELISLFILAFIDQSSQRYETCLSDYYDNEQGFPRCVLWDCIKGANRVSFQSRNAPDKIERLKSPYYSVRFSDEYEKLVDDFCSVRVHSGEKHEDGICRHK